MHSIGFEKLRRSLLAIHIAVSISSCYDPASNCDENSDAVGYARSLSDVRLARIFEDAHSDLAEGKELYRAGPSRDNGPEWLSDIEYHDVIISHTRSRIMLQGCFDHYVLMQIDGLGGSTDGDDPAIVLTWGEGPEAGSEILWPKQ